MINRCFLPIFDRHDAAAGKNVPVRLLSHLF